MKIEKVYIGGWFQRTTLQLSEIYDFLRDGTSQLALEQHKLNELHKNLCIESISYQIDGFEQVIINTLLNISIKIVEDGLIILNSNSPKINDESLPIEINSLADYYENRLSPAFSYLFSLGAPIPKELSSIKTVYPYFVVLNNEKKDVIDGFLHHVEQTKYFEFTGSSYDVYRGDKYYVINSKSDKNTKKQEAAIRRYIEEQVFIREFKGQLHHYLNLHRTVWEKIDVVKETGKIKGTEVGKFNSKIQSYAKTINLVEGRINQMDTYLHTRAEIAKEDTRLNSFLDLIEYRYDTLGHTLSYIQELWGMTKNHVESAIDVFSSIQSKATQDSVNDLAVVTSMGVGASLLGLFTTTEMPSVTIIGVLYFFILAAVGYLSNKIMKSISRNKKYKISSVEYDKNIK